MWKDIRISKKGNLNFKDVCKIINVTCDNTTEKYIADHEKIYINDRLHITESAAIKFIIMSNNKASVNYCKKYLCDRIDKNIDGYTICQQQIYCYSEHKISFFVVNDTKWYKAKDIGDILGYSNTRDFVLRQVNKNDRCNYKKLVSSAYSLNTILLINVFINPQTIFVNTNGLKHMLLKSDKPNAISLARKFDIEVNQKFTRKEIDIVYELDLFCKSANIKSIFQHIVFNDSKKYGIDYYFPDYKLAIEIDEFDHSYRDQIYEKKREQFLKKKLQCRFIRCNPDDDHFSISGLIGRIHSAIVKVV